MSNANTPAMMAQSMAESLFRENARLKKIEESYYRLLELDSGDVMIDTLNENDRLKEQNALLTVQVEQMRHSLQQIAEDKYLPSDDPGYWKQRWQEIARAALTALHQQVKSEDARDAARYRHMRKSFETSNSATSDFGRDPKLVWYLPQWDRNLPWAERLDAAIDAAISAQENKS